MCGGGRLAPRLQNFYPPAPHHPLKKFSPPQKKFFFSISINFHTNKNCFWRQIFDISTCPLKLGLKKKKKKKSHLNPIAPPSLFSLFFPFPSLSLSLSLLSPLSSLLSFFPSVAFWWRSFHSMAYYIVFTSSGSSITAVIGRAQSHYVQLPWAEKHKI